MPAIIPTMRYDEDNESERRQSPARLVLYVPTFSRYPLFFVVIFVLICFVDILVSAVEKWVHYRFRCLRKMF